MADAEIQVLITLRDEMSAGFEKIQRTLEQGNANIVKTTEQTTSAFQSQVSNLIAVGNAASAVDRIWTSYQNLQIRLENASERLTNSQERLEDAQRKLNRMFRDGKATADDLADAQREVERASRLVTISQNNLQRAQNQVVGTYIQMGIGIAQLLQTLPTFIKWIRSGQAATEAWALAEAILTALTNPLGLAIGIAAAAAGVYAVNAMFAKDATDAGASSVYSYSQSQDGLASSVSYSNTQLDNQATAINNVDKAMDASVMSLEAKFYAIQAYYKSIPPTMEEIQAATNKANEAENKFYQDLAIKSSQTTIKVTQDWKVMQEESSKLNKLFADSVTVEYDRIIAKQNEMINNQERLKLTGGETGFLAGEYTTKEGTKMAYSSKSLEEIYGTKGDFISRPGQSPVSFSPNDTIIGTSDMGNLRGGISITITGNIYGTDPDEIAEALVNKLRRKISI